MSSIEQPSILNNNGAIVTIGIRVNTDRCAIVMPFVTDDVVLDELTFCNDLVITAQTHILTSLTAVMSVQSYVSFIAAEGMIDGRIPYRVDYAPTDHPGLLTGPPVPSQVSGLVIWYEDPRDVVAGHKLRVAKNFIPGLPSANVTGNIIDSALVDTLQALADNSQNGYETNAGSGKWYRCLAAPRPRTPGTSCKRTTGQLGRDVVYTQKRRLIPRD